MLEGKPEAPQAATKAPAVEILTAAQLSNKEIKELKKREKAAKRASQKEAAGISPEQQQQMAQYKIEKKNHQVTNTNLKKQLSQAVFKDADKKIPALFSHLETREQRNASSPTVSHIVHPDILTLSLQFSSHKIIGSTARLRSVLQVFKAVIQDYKTPKNTTLSRHLTGHLSHQIEYLKSSRPLSVSMGNAIRWLKQEIARISIDTLEDKAKVRLVNSIDEFIREKIDLSDQLIIENSAHHITKGSTVLTFGHSEVLLKLFQYCVIEQLKLFNLVVVDSHPLFEGRKLLSSLLQFEFTSIADGLKTASTNNHVGDRSVSDPVITRDVLKVSYVLMNSLSSTVLEDVDVAFLGAHAMLSNGHLFSRVGTAMVAMMCHRRNIPVLTCCESIKFSERVQLDSVTTNELADPEDLVTNTGSKKAPQRKLLALEYYKKFQEASLERKETLKKATDRKDDFPNDSDILKDWKTIPLLNILNIMYDLTPPLYINKVVTELGSLPPSSVPVILREYKSS